MESFVHNDLVAFEYGRGKVPSCHQDYAPLVLFAYPF
jgi:hypothetical protein